MCFWPSGEENIYIESNSIDLLSIDVGKNNLATVAFGENGKILNWELRNLEFPSQYNPSKYFKILDKYFQELKPSLRRSAIVLIERQLNGTVQGFNCSLRTNLLIEALLFAIIGKEFSCFSVLPQNVSKFFALESGARKKQSAVAKALEMLKQDKLNDKWEHFLIDQRKKDDLADCFLQALYFKSNRIKFNQ